MNQICVCPFYDTNSMLFGVYFELFLNLFLNISCHSSRKIYEFNAAAAKIKATHSYKNLNHNYFFFDDESTDFILYIVTFVDHSFMQASPEPLNTHLMKLSVVVVYFSHVDVKLLLLLLMLLYVSCYKFCPCICILLLLLLKLHVYL